MGGRKSTNSLWACLMCSALNISIKFHSAFLYAIVFGHHVLMCGSTTRGLNFSQFSEYQIFGRKCAEYQILSKTSDLLNILTYTKNRPIFTGGNRLRCSKKLICNLCCLMHSCHSFLQQERLSF